MPGQPGDAAGAGLILVAAGQGTRLGGRRPKALVPLGPGAAAEPILAHALRGALRCAALTEVVVVAPPGPDDLDAVAAAVAGVDPGRGGDGARRVRIQVVPGGAERSDSVACGLQALPAQVDVVLVHDAARALTPPELFDRVVAAVRSGHVAVTPALPVTDTVKQVEPGAAGVGTVAATLDRSTLRAVQTPQGFRRRTLERAHAEIEHAVTDDCGMVESLGVTVHVVEGSPRAMKITTPQDLEVAAGWVADGADRGGVGALLPRTGVGVDVHAWAQDDRPLWLGCLEWPGERGIEGHSDGDVAAHAACNALLSAAGLGDLGSVFGTDRPQMAGASGSQMLTAVADLLEESGFQIGNVAVQVLARHPRVGSRRREMEAAMSAALGGAPVSVSAATTDGLGFVGRVEGLAGVATALVARG